MGEALELFLHKRINQHQGYAKLGLITSENEWRDGIAGDES